MSEMPVALSLSHGGGPCFFMDSQGSPMEQVDKNSKATTDYKQIPSKFPRPSAIVLVTAHWEGDAQEQCVLVTGDARPKLLFDYYGFPAETYKIEYSAPGHPELAKQVVEALSAAGIKSRLDTGKRGWDHGVFIPLKLMYPEADIPIVQVSIHPSLDAETHMRMGEALRVLHESHDKLFDCREWTGHA